MEKKVAMTDKIVFSACGSSEEARKLAHHLVEKRAAACVNLIPGAYSVFRWEGKVDETPAAVGVLRRPAGAMWAS